MLQEELEMLRGIELLITNDKEKAKMIADELNEENKTDRLWSKKY